LVLTNHTLRKVAEATTEYRDPHVPKESD
jgi:hypothetical protein